MRERKRDRQREGRDRQRERERDSVRERKRERDRQRERERQWEREKMREREVASPYKVVSTGLKRSEQSQVDRSRFQGQGHTSVTPDPGSGSPLGAEV